ncbi:general secretion pathway protein GspB [Alteromonas sp. 14N.309.X.WAT.G.H12]|uniref:general secretion pathway protein GspB n=1 Tax=Alteromonas sp. 14N.309.X.WAT.G.H12 TaxID=3120824 RepID=UPI002FD2A6A6
MSDILDIDKVKPGMVIVQITKQNGPVKIRKSGLVTSQAMVQGLAEMGVQQVEIDPDQTVEIENNTQYRTQTQALIRGDRDTSARALDHTLSDQFNRSLFLPTVQGLPSLWKKNVRQLMRFSLVILVGVGVGFIVGAYPLWWPTSSDAEVASNTMTTTGEEQQDPSNLSQQAVDAGRDTALQSVTSPASSSSNTVTGEMPTMPVSPQTEGTSLTSNKETAAPTPEDDSEIEGEILNAPPEDDVEVSPELMARFNQAIAELDNTATDEKKETKVNVRDDMPRVDQLPVRMLTRLPSMTFSAHMYASEKSDRWVRVNGKQLGEGDWIGDKVQIVKIEPQRVILNFEGKSFSMAALTDW